MGAGFHVHLDGTIWQDAKPLWQLRDGELFAADGTVMDASGRVTHVVAHYLRRGGEFRLVVQGDETPVAPGTQLADGTQLLDHGFVVMPDGSRSYLEDGQGFALPGGELPSWDTVTFRNGKVTVYKDGTLLELDRNRVLMMSEGTKVFGDGRVVRRDRENDWAEATFQLPEGSLLKLPGATNEKRLRTGH
jgi:hypothetical protein